MTRAELLHLVGEWKKSGAKVMGPVESKPGVVLFADVESPEALRLDGWVRPANSIKEAVFPRHEVLYGYRIEGRRVELTPPPEIDAPVIVVGAHPCDAAALVVLDAVFNWDCRDEFYNRRRAAVTVVTLACASSDDQCFCTSVGLAPDAVRGSDALLVESAGGYQVRVLSEKGGALFGGVPELPPEQACSAWPPYRFDPLMVRAFASTRFDDPFWAEHALACVGCGACAYTCPVCHCFDIVDEAAPGGVRARNWDTCQFPMFTLHAGGHNPRRAQGDRQRQRIYHKFFMYPEKFGEILCTGCGNCARNCPVGLGVLPVITEMPDGKPVSA